MFVKWSDVLANNSRSETLPKATNTNPVSGINLWCLLILPESSIEHYNYNIAKQ